MNTEKLIEELWIEYNRLAKRREEIIVAGARLEARMEFIENRIKVLGAKRK